MHDFIHQYCFLVHYSFRKLHFNSAKSSADGVSIGLYKMDLAARF